MNAPCRPQLWGITVAGRGLKVNVTTKPHIALVRFHFAGIAFLGFNLV